MMYVSGFANYYYLKNNEGKRIYLSFENQDIIIILSTLHYALINLFKCMNERLPTKNYTNHFWADPSRELLYTIEKTGAINPGAI